MNVNEIAFSGNIGVFEPNDSSWHKLLRMTVSENGVFAEVDTSKSMDVTTFERYLLPGFIDAHCHLLETPYYSESSSEISSVHSEDLMKRALQNTLCARNSGITALRDLGGRAFESLNVLNKLTSDLPRVVTSGCYFTWERGHAYDRGAITIRNISEFKTHIARLHACKIKFVKILHGDNGFATPLLKEMVSVAHDKGMKVSCHAYTNTAATEAVVAGADILEHVGDYDEALLTVIKKNGIIVVPTFAAAYDSTNENCADITDFNSQILQTWLTGEKTVIPKIIEKGIPFALGSDAGFYCFPMDYLHREIELLHSVFKIPMEHLTYVAFITTPQCLGMENKLGQIAPDFYADFLVYEENPLKNFAVLRSPTQVWIGGKKVVDIDVNALQARRLSESDIDNVLKYLSHSYFNCGNLDDRWTFDDLVNWFENESDYCIGVFFDKELIGFCLSHIHIEAHKVHLENVFVKEEYRHRGIARRMLKKTISHYSARSGKIRFVGLVDASNVQSQHLLNRCGFTKGAAMLWLQKNVIKND
ncbi:hypothetical protein FACS1894139_04030 [Planctomycetales bacterium]|nr:hypothetical protein FACS1894108_03680 [Planctomycetales bacterium]GHT03535.1 hypothetical protein FACS1894139_04030 [Planctomycetales bacterium]